MRKLTDIMYLIGMAHLFILFYTLSIHRLLLKEMSLKKAGFKSRCQKNYWVTLVIPLVVLLLILPGNAKEKKGNNRLPPAPDTGAPKEDFSAGGTRDNRRVDMVCGVGREQIAYLLGSENREFTLSAHPTFWFHIPSSLNKEARLKFTLEELETGKKIYDGSLERTESSIMGISLPKEEPYALSPETNYAWSLEIDCTGANQPEIVSGWVTRLSSQSKLQNKLATTPEANKHTVYLEHNILYDALCQLAHRRMAKPNDAWVETEWNQLLTELGWRELVQHESPNKPSISLLPISD